MGKIVDIYKFLTKYNLIDKLELLRTSFLFINSTEKSFSKEDWALLVKPHLPESSEIVSVLFSILKSESLIEELNSREYRLSNKELLDESFKMMCFYRDFNVKLNLKSPSRLLWNMQFKIKEQLPPNLRMEFEELTSYLKDILSIAQNQIYFCAPYFSISGIRILLNSIQSALAINQDLKIWFIVDAIELDYTQTFINDITKILPKDNLRILVPRKNTNNELLFHSKFLIVDNKYGYLGSANFSERALSQQFEIGIKLFEEDCSKISLLVKSWIDLSHFRQIL